RVVEDGGGLVGDDVYVEDQLQRSEVGSSCAFGGQGSVRAVLEGLDEADSDSDVSACFAFGGAGYWTVKGLQSR
ncbi:hypothetical protein A2U01_0104058, partial [Trifolium medium]|nr:hypothetical protein [Trifolium medium]